jgi:nucleotide-binding universal stress UspA family protein
VTVDAEMKENEIEMKIMVCYDNSDEAKEALKEAREHGRAFKGEVMAVASVVSDHQYHPEMMEPVEQGLKEAQAFFDESKIPCKTRISFRSVDMSAGEDLVLFAEREKVDEVIIGIRNRSKVGKFSLGTTAQWLLLKAECAVVGVKKKALSVGVAANQKS